MIMRKEQVNLGSIERSNAMLTISYILLIIVSNCNKLSKSAENAWPGAIFRPRCKNIFFVCFNFSESWQPGFEP